MIFDGVSWLLLAAVCSRPVTGWVWPEGSESVRIDTKVRFVDHEPPAPAPAPSPAAAAHAHDNYDKGKRNHIQTDNAPFVEPTETEGFYNQPPGSGRYPMHSVDSYKAAYIIDNANVYPVHSSKWKSCYFRNNFDQLTYCKCFDTPACAPKLNSEEKCGPGKYLCCYKRPNKEGQVLGEFFNDIDEEPPMLYPGKERSTGPFPPPPVTDLKAAPVLVGPNGPTGQIGPNGHTSQTTHNRGFLVGLHRPILAGPNGPTGNIGPDRPVLTGPNGPTGLIGPAGAKVDIKGDGSAQRGVLVGPGGPTGSIGPYGQRGILVGPGGPTGLVGPRGGGSRGILVGPGGSTGYIGPGYDRHTNPGILVGPGGPTGIIGPGRQLLVGPGGPTGHIGPNRYFGNQG